MKEYNWKEHGVKTKWINITRIGTVLLYFHLAILGTEDDFKA